MVPLLPSISPGGRDANKDVGRNDGSSRLKGSACTSHQGCVVLLMYKGRLTMVAILAFTSATENEIEYSNTWVWACSIVGVDDSEEDVDGSGCDTDGEPDGCCGGMGESVGSHVIGPKGCAWVGTQRKGRYRAIISRRVRSTNRLRFTSPRRWMRMLMIVS